MIIVAIFFVLTNAWLMAYAVSNKRDDIMTAMTVIQLALMVAAMIFGG